MEPILSPLEGTLASFYIATPPSLRKKCGARGGATICLPYGLLN